MAENILGYFKEVKAQKQINKLAKKYKNKRIVIYGAGVYFNILNENYDLSKLNIVAISDKKFETEKSLNPTPWQALAPKELRDFDFDVLLMALYDDTSIIQYMKFDLLFNTKNEKNVVCSLIEPTLLYIIRVLIFGK